MRLRSSRLLLACIVISLIVHFTAGPFLVWLFGRNSNFTAPREIVFYARSSALRIAHRVRPLPPRRVPRPQPVQPQPKSVVRRPQPERMQAPKRELARIDPRASQPQPTPGIATEISKDENQFQKTIAELREQNNPVVSAARAEPAPQTIKHYAFNVAGQIAPGPRAQGILEPLPGSPWRQGGYDYYYVRYWVEYADGTTERGIVPWPLRYLPGDDPFRRGIYHIPLPKPLPDYQLPPGTNVRPLVAYCLAHRDQVQSCPIMHD